MAERERHAERLERLAEAVRAAAKRLPDRPITGEVVACAGIMGMANWLEEVAALLRRAEPDVTCPVCGTPLGARWLTQDDEDGDDNRPLLTDEPGPHPTITPMDGEGRPISGDMFAPAAPQGDDVEALTKALNEECERVLTTSQRAVIMPHIRDLCNALRSRTEANHG